LRILIVGVTGLIGSAIAARLVAEGHKITGISRRPPQGLALVRHISLDMALATEVETWLPCLEGLHAVLYCAGLLQEGSGESLRAVHEAAPRALFAACEVQKLKRVIYLSAVGVDRDAPTEFSRTKRVAEEALVRHQLDWVILRPSVVVGRAAYGGSALLRGLASLPLLPIMRGAGSLQVVHLDDLVETVSFFLRPGAPTHVVLDLVGPRRWRFDELVALFRRWLGWPPADRLVLPHWLVSLLFGLGDLAGVLGWRPPLRSVAGREILRGATGNPEQWTELTGIVPRDLETALRNEPASVQERWFARLYLLKPIILTVASLFWIVTGIVALGPGWRQGVALLAEGDVPSQLVAPVVIGGALCNIAIGLAIAWRRTSRWGLYAALALTAAYAVIATVLLPRLWTDPMGPLLKMVPVVALHLVVLAIVDDR
jgi:uncharacterized protein YbjT (DUF2867 family)